jgi:acetyl-CoA acetyltransferase
MDTLVSGAPLAKETAFKMAGVELKDIDVVELYDCYTFTVLITLEDYGFCRKGEGGPSSKAAESPQAARSRSIQVAAS